jgi:secretion/DNA translocation related CpaE-like protein
LIITDDRDLLDDLLRCAAAADIEPDVAHVAAHARPYWARAPLVLVGADLADPMAATAPPSRPGVLLVTRSPAGPEVWRQCVAVGGRAVLELPTDERRLVDEFADAAEPSGHAGAVVCVVGGRGGAGASVLATSLALTAARHRLRVLLVDADPLGGGIDVLLGQEEAAGARWPDIVEREGRVGFTALRQALPTFGGLTVLSWHRGEPMPIPVGAMRAVLEAAHRGCDLAVVDLPRHIDPGAGEALARATSTFVVVPADLRGVLATCQILVPLRRHTTEIRSVIRPGSLPRDVVTSTLALPAAGTMLYQRGLSEALERGDAPPLGRRTPLGRLCAHLLRQVADTAAPSGTAPAGPSARRYQGGPR